MVNYSDMKDEQLVLLSQDGDSAAVSELAIRYSKVSFAIASTFCADREECADLSQEGMLGFLSAIYSYRENGKASFLTYASHCIRNKILSALRKSTSGKQIPESLIISLQQISETSVDPDTPEELLISQNNAKTILSLIDECLSPREKTVLTLFLSGNSYVEIAETLNTSSKAVDSALQRARKKLKEKLQNNF